MNTLFHSLAVHEIHLAKIGNSLTLLASDPKQLVNSSATGCSHNDFSVIRFPNFFHLANAAEVIAVRWAEFLLAVGPHANVASWARNQGKPILRANTKKTKTRQKNENENDCDIKIYVCYESISMKQSNEFS